MISRTLNRLAVVHPLFFAAAPILLLAADNIAEISPSVLTIPLGVSTAAALVIFLVLAAVRRDARKAAAMTSAAVLLFFFYGHAFDVLYDSAVITDSSMLYLLLNLVALAVLGAAGVYLWRTKRDLARLTQFAALTGLIVCFVGGRELLDEYKHSDEMKLIRRAEAVKQAEEARKNTAQKNPAESQPEEQAAARPPRIAPIEHERPDLPDIYYIILDGYARADVLRDVYGYDNSEFIGCLEKQGFFVARDSMANYPMTFLSLASSLNVRYVNDDAQRLGVKSTRVTPIYAMIKDNYVGRYLQSKGYRYLHIATHFGATEDSIVADETYYASHPFLQKEFITTLMKTTALRPFAPSVARTHLFALNKLTEIAEIDGPTFTFAHILLPHNPYVFDRYGNVCEDIRPSLQFESGYKTGGWYNKRGYVEQLIFLNKKMREVVDAILARSKHPPVIIIQADHGSASRIVYGETKYKQVPFVRERMPILNAYLVPDSCRAMLSHDVTPVNTFRILFNGLFGERFELLENRHYFAWYGRPYNLKDVTQLFQPQTEALGN